VELLDFLLDPWRSGIGRRALIEVMLVGGFGGALAFWVVEERLGYAAESLAHGLLPGLVIAALAGAPLLLGAAGGAVVAAAVIALAAADERVGPETGTAVAVTGLLGLGLLLALSPDAPPRLEELLFGDPLGVGDGDLIAAAVLFLAGGALLAALHRPLAALSFDAAGSAALGIRRARLRVLLLLLLAAAVAVGVQGLGNLLVLAVLVAPAVAVRRHAATPAVAMLAGGGLSALAGAAGIYVSFHAGAAAGACVALALCLLAVCGARLPATSA
jgi:ABC-type Mn2+/Zn2+ transport system permease subunit